MAETVTQKVWVKSMADGRTHFEGDGTALHQNASVAAEFFVAAKLRKLVHVQVHVARDKEIDVSITVVVGPGRAGHEAAAANAGFVGHVFGLQFPKPR